MIKLTDHFFVLASEIIAVTMTKAESLPGLPQFTVFVFTRTWPEPFTYRGSELKAREVFNRVMNELDPAHFCNP